MCCSEQHEQSLFTEYMLVLHVTSLFIYTKNNTHMTGMSAAKLLREHEGPKRQ